MAQIKMSSDKLNELKFEFMNTAEQLDLSIDKVEVLINQLNCNWTGVAAQSTTAMIQEKLIQARALKELLIIMAEKIGQTSAALENAEASMANIFTQFK